MSFFMTSTGENAAANATGEFKATNDSGFELIPKDTRVLAMCEEAKIIDNNYGKLVNLKWVIAQPAEYKNRVIFQKIRLWQDTAEKNDKALKMLAAIDANCGGKLAAAEIESKDDLTDLLLQQCLTAKPMVLLLDIWNKSKDDNGNDIPKAEQKNHPGGNFVAAVSKYAPGAKAAAAPKPAAATKPAPKPAPVADIDDETIPF